jgi:hypothetical protein
LEPEDRDLDTELYQVTISGRNIMIAPGKTRMEEGIAYAYAYVIKQKKVVCKLGVYEKKTDTMPLVFDLSMFPDGAMCLFEEYDKNPALLLDLEMSDTQTVFDYLMPLYEKIPEKKKRMKLAYRNLHDTYKKGDPDKDMKTILLIISAASKEDEPTDAFIQKLQEKITDTRQFVSTMLVLQYVFQMEIVLNTEDPALLALISRWNVGKVTTTLEVDVLTQELIRERPYAEKEAKPEVETVPEPVEPVPEPVTEPVPTSVPKPSLLKPSLLKPLAPPDPFEDIPPDTTEKAPDTTEKAPDTTEKATVKKTRVKKTPKPEELRIGTSLNSVIEPKAKIQLKKSKKVSKIEE